MEVNNNALLMGSMITWDMQYPTREFEICYHRKKQKVCNFLSLSVFFKSSENILEEIQEAVDEKPWVVKTDVGTEKDKDYNSIECIVITLYIVPEIDKKLFLEACELLEDETMAKKFAVR